MPFPAAQQAGLVNTWGAGCDLQYALASVAVSGDEIWVEAGTYKPTTGTSRDATFQLRNGIALYGGFAGTETARDQRALPPSQTILSGDIGAAGDITDNSYHVVTGSGTNNTAVLNGFKISGGNGNYSTGMTYDPAGGGIRNISGSPTLQNIIIRDNTAYRGAGMFNYNGSSPILSNVEIISNSATGSPGIGGG